MSGIPTLQIIGESEKRIRSYVHKTPVLQSSHINSISGARVYFKCENFQKAGAFKFRGAMNAVLSLTPDEREKGVATHSSGNHGQALALAAKTQGIKAHIVMPENSPSVKRKAVEGYGAEVISCGPTQRDREETLNSVVDRTGAVFIHPYNNYRIIAGQATAAKELMEEVPGLEAIVAPVGGGGLVSGTALAARYLSPETKVFAAEPKGADDAYRSVQSGKLMPCHNPDTIADGLRASLGEKTFSIIRTHVAEIVTLTDAQIVAAMQLVWERMKIIIEPSSAVAVAAVLGYPDWFSGKKTGVIISGGNVDLQNLPFAGRYAG